MDSTGLYLNGAAPTVPAVDMTASGVKLNSGDPMVAMLTYDGTTLSLTVRDTVTQRVFSTGWAVNIPQAVGGSTAYAGFTGGTGVRTAVQQVLNWSYSIAAPATATPAFSPAGGVYGSAQSVTISDAAISLISPIRGLGWFGTAISASFATP